MNSEQKTFSTKSLTMPALATLMIGAGAILSSQATATDIETCLPEYQCSVAGDSYLTTGLQVGSITNSSVDVEIVHNKFYPQEVQPRIDYEIDTAINVIQEFSFLEVDDEIDKRIDDYFGAKPLKSKKIFIAKHNR